MARTQGVARHRGLGANAGFTVAATPWRVIKRYVRTRLGIFNVKDYGAKGDGTTDDTAAIQAAKAAAGVSGQIHFPPGTYLCASGLDFEGARSLRLTGPAAITAGAAPAVKLIYGGTGSTRFINARSTYGFVMQDIAVHHSDSGFTGSLVDLTHGVAATDSSGARFERCQFSGTGRSARAFDLDTCISSQIVGCAFTGGLDVGVRGGLAGSYCNAITVRDCSFIGFGTIAIRDLGQGCTIESCTFEPLNSGNAGAFDHVNISVQGLIIKGNWCGDANTSGTWFTVAGDAIEITGNFISAGSISVEINGSSHGITVTGNKFKSSATGLKLTSCVGTFVAGNKFLSLTTGGVDVANSQTYYTIINNRFETITGGFGVRFGTSANFCMVMNNSMSGVTTEYSYVGSMPTGGHIQQSSAGFTIIGSLMQVAGAVSDASFPATPPNGTLAIDTTNLKIYVRIGGAWKSVVVA